jgi:predicted  nucleic acid-binding Zn-ribbon protein
MEEKHTKTLEVADLQDQLREALARQKARAGDVVDEVMHKVDEFTEETKEAGRAVAESVREGREEVGKATETVGKVAGGGWWPW